MTEEIVSERIHNGIVEIDGYPGDDTFFRPLASKPPAVSFDQWMENERKLRKIVERDNFARKICKTRSLTTLLLRRDPTISPNIFANPKAGDPDLSQNSSPIPIVFYTTTDMKFKQGVHLIKFGYVIDGGYPNSFIQICPSFSPHLPPGDIIIGEPKQLSGSAEASLVEPEAAKSILSMSITVITGGPDLECTIPANSPLATMVVVSASHYGFCLFNHTEIVENNEILEDC